MPAAPAELLFPGAQHTATPSPISKTAPTSLTVSTFPPTRLRSRAMLPSTSIHPPRSWRATWTLSLALMALVPARTVPRRLPIGLYRAWRTLAPDRGSTACLVRLRGTRLFRWPRSTAQGCNPNLLFATTASPRQALANHRRRLRARSLRWRLRAATEPAPATSPLRCQAIRLLSPRPRRLARTYGLLRLPQLPMLRLPRSTSRHPR